MENLKKMQIEEFKGTTRIHRSSPGGGVEYEYSEKKGSPLVRFDSYRHPFLMSEMSCTNPECNCSEIHLSFKEIDESLIPISDPIEFSFTLSLETWQEKKIHARSRLSQSFVDDFIDNLTDEMKTRFKEQYAHIKEKFRNASRFKMPVDEIKKGSLASYTDVFGNLGSVLSGGTGIGFKFENNGKEYFIDDLYCINPRCKCKSIHLIFLRYDEEKDSLVELFVGILSFKKGLEIDEANSFCTKKEALKIFADWKKSKPWIIDLLKKRYEEMKDIGRRIFTEAAKLDREKAGKP